MYLFFANATRVATLLILEVTIEGIMTHYIHVAYVLTI